MLLHSGHDLNQLLDNYSLAELQFMAEVVLPVHLRPYETLNAIMGSFAGEKGGKKAAPPAQDFNAFSAGMGLVKGKIPAKPVSDMW